MAIELGPSHQAEQSAKRHLLLASRLLRYSDFWEYEEGEETKFLSIEQFSDLVSLAALELFHGNPTAEEVADLLSIDPPGVEAARRHPQYGPIRESFEERFRAVAGSRDMKSWGDVLESELSLEMAELALSPSTKGRQKTDAASAFLDRQSAKAGRGDGEGRVLIVPKDLLELMERAQETWQLWEGQRPQKLLPEEVHDAEYEEVSATRLNVPEDEEGAT